MFQNKWSMNTDTKVDWVIWNLSILSFLALLFSRPVLEFGPSSSTFLGEDKCTVIHLIKLQKLQRSVRIHSCVEIGPIISLKTALPGLVYLLMQKGNTCECVKVHWLATHKSHKLVSVPEKKLFHLYFVFFLSPSCIYLISLFINSFKDSKWHLLQKLKLVDRSLLSFNRHLQSVTMWKQNIMVCLRAK